MKTALLRNKTKFIKMIDETQNSENDQSIENQLSLDMNNKSFEDTRNTLPDLATGLDATFAEHRGSMYDKTNTLNELAFDVIA